MNTIKAFTVPKVGENYRNSNDRFFFNATKQGETYFCISDGAGSSFDPTLFAELITQYPVVNSQTNFEKEDIEKIQKEWSEKVERRIESKLFSNKIADLYNVLKREAGATFVRMCFYEENEKKMWKATALGDSVMLFIPYNEELPQYVVSTNQDCTNEHKYTNSDYVFDASPDGLLSRSECNLSKQSGIKDEIKKGTFIFMTDALAAWVLGTHKHTKDRIRKLLKISSHEEFVQFVSGIRDEVDVTDQQGSVSKKMGTNSEIDNDDTTVMIITIDDTKKFKFTENNIICTDIEKIIDEEIDEEIDNINKKLQQYTEKRKQYNDKKKDVEQKARALLSAKKFNIDNIHDLQSNLNSLKELYKNQDENTKLFENKKKLLLQQIQKTPISSLASKDIDVCHGYLDDLINIQEIESTLLQKIDQFEQKCFEYSEKLKDDFRQKHSATLDTINDIKSKLEQIEIHQSESEEEKLKNNIERLKFLKYNQKMNQQANVQHNSFRAIDKIATKLNNLFK